MKVVVLYHPNSEHARVVEEFAHDFSKEHPGSSLDLMSVDTKAGADMAALYDIMQYPAILALDDKAELLKFWQGDLPLKSEVAFYAIQPA